MQQRTDQIAAILAKRKPFAEKIAAVNENLDSLRDGLLDLQHALASVEPISDANRLGALDAVDGNIKRAISDTRLTTRTDKYIAR
jgi:hypothetical protein